MLRKLVAFVLVGAYCDTPQRELHSVLSKKPFEPPMLQHDGKGKKVKVWLDTHGRKGKTVTVVSGLQHNPDTMQDIARLLKQHCGAGGTVKDKNIEVQGDQRERVKEKLKQLNYEVS